MFHSIIRFPKECSCCNPFSSSAKVVLMLSVRHMDSIDVKYMDNITCECTLKGIQG